MKTINNSIDVFNAVKDILRDEEQENLLLLSLNGANVLTGISFLGLGSDAAVVISPKLIARTAVLSNARSVVLVHNHPSGNPHPSMADIKMTEKVKEGLAIFDITVVDHVIISTDSFYSFSEETTLNVKDL